MRQRAWLFLLAVLLAGSGILLVTRGAAGSYVRDPAAAAQQRPVATLPGAGREKNAPAIGSKAKPPAASGTAPPVAPVPSVQPLASMSPSAAPVSSSPTPRPATPSVTPLMSQPPPAADRSAFVRQLIAWPDAADEDGSHAEGDRNASATHKIAADNNYDTAPHPQARQSRAELEAAAIKLPSLQQHEGNALAQHLMTQQLTGLAESAVAAPGSGPTRRQTLARDEPVLLPLLDVLDDRFVRYALQPAEGDTAGLLQQPPAVDIDDDDNDDDDDDNDDDDELTVGSMGAYSTRAEPLDPAETQWVQAPLPFRLCRNDGAGCVPMVRRKRTAMVVDMIMFSWEFEMLALRLDLYEHVVDYVIVYEALFDQNAKPKRAYFDEFGRSDPRFARHLHRIVHVIDPMVYPHQRPDDENNFFWAENHLRNQLGVLGVPRLPVPLQGDDVVLMSDLDELVEPHVLELLKLYTPSTHHYWALTIKFRTSSLAYFWRHYATATLRIASSAAWFTEVLHNQANRLRYGHPDRSPVELELQNGPHSVHGGWHCSCCFAVANYRLKIRHILEIDEWKRSDPLWLSADFGMHLRQAGRDFHLTPLEPSDRSDPDWAPPHAQYFARHYPALMDETLSLAQLLALGPPLPEYGERIAPRLLPPRLRESPAFSQYHRDCGDKPVSARLRVVVKPAKVVPPSSVDRLARYLACALLPEPPAHLSVDDEHIEHPTGGLVVDDTLALALEAWHNVQSTRRPSADNDLAGRRGVQDDIRPPADAPPADAAAAQVAAVDVRAVSDEAAVPEIVLLLCRGGADCHTDTDAVGLSPSRTILFLLDTLLPDARLQQYARAIDEAALVLTFSPSLSRHVASRMPRPVMTLPWWHAMDARLTPFSDAGEFPQLGAAACAPLHTHVGSAVAGKAAVVLLGVATSSRHSEALAALKELARRTSETQSFNVVSVDDTTPHDGCLGLGRLVVILREQPDDVLDMLRVMPLLRDGNLVLAEMGPDAAELEQAVQFFNAGSLGHMCDVAAEILASTQEWKQKRAEHVRKWVADRAISVDWLPADMVRTVLGVHCDACSPAPLV